MTMSKCKAARFSKSLRVCFGPRCEQTIDINSLQRGRAAATPPKTHTCSKYSWRDGLANPGPLSHCHKTCRRKFALPLLQRRRTDAKVNSCIFWARLCTDKHWTLHIWIFTRKPSNNIHLIIYFLFKTQLMGLTYSRLNLGFHSFGGGIKYLRDFESLPKGQDLVFQWQSCQFVSLSLTQASMTHRSCAWIGNIFPS